MTLFFLIVFILSFSPCENISQETRYCDLAVRIVRWGSFVCFFIGLGYFAIMELVRKPSSFNQSVEILKYETHSYENLSFLASYFMPLVSFNLLYLSHVVVMILLVTCIGIIFVQSGKYYTNPTLSLFSYKVYSIKGLTKALKEEERKEVEYMVICRGKMSDIKWISTLKIEDNFYYAKPAES